MADLKGIPAHIYSLFWHTRELGFLDKILKQEKVKFLRVVFFFKDYLPGALLILDGIKGEYDVLALESIESIEYDCLIEGSLQEYIKIMKFSFFLTEDRLTALFASRRIYLKGIHSLYKLSKIMAKLVY